MTPLNGETVARKDMKPCIDDKNFFEILILKRDDIKEMQCISLPGRRAMDVILFSLTPVETVSGTEEESIHGLHRSGKRF